MPIRPSSRRTAADSTPGTVETANRATPDDRLAKLLGWASLGLGVPQLTIPGQVARALAVGTGQRQRVTIMAVGGRELAAAAGLLARPHAAWLWGRVAGDAMDLTLLGRAIKNHDGRGLGRTVTAFGAVVGITAADLYAAITRSGSRPLETTSATTVLTSPHEAYAFWRQLDNLPQFMRHLDEVRVLTDRTSRWRAKAPLGRAVEWDAEIVEDVPAERLSWRSTPDADIRNEGDVRFVPAPGDRGTEIHVRLRYNLPAGKLGQAVARYFGEDPRQQLDDDLRRLKQVLETGEVVRSDGAPGGKHARREFPQRPAQPLSAAEREQ
jgi:uncharacterized membrane protein